MGRSSTAPGLRSRHRGGRINVVTVVLLLIVGLGLGWFKLFGMYYIDFLNMREVVKSSALEWYAKVSEPAARTRLTQMLATKEIDYVPIESCTFAQQGLVLTVGCTWKVDVYYPFTKYYKRLEFQTTAEVNERGVVTQY